jgi:nucleotide-binding universal stress UspA family protein
MSSKPYRVVIGTDFSEHAIRALRAAYEQARGHHAAELHVVHASLMASPDAGQASAARLAFGSSPVLSLEEQRQQLASHLDRQVASLEGFSESAVKVFGHVIVEVPSLAIVALASQLGASLIVVGSHGLRGFSRWILGSVAEGVVRRAECPVLVIPPPARQLETPHIEPPCPRCLETRAATSGQDLWCPQHHERHGRRHTYHQGDRIGADSNLPLTVL